MAKKNWIYIKRGLSEDAKHRAAMGECIWLFLHIIDRADWETGIAYDWKDEQEAANMGMPVRTLREQRRKLDELNYVSCKQRQYGQDIIIKKWINPRDYSGKVINQGGSETEPEGYAQGYTQGSTQDVTPTSDSESKSLIKKQKTEIKGIEAAMFGNRPVSESDLPIGDEALKAFERDMQCPGSWSWYPAKSTDEPAWKYLREFVVKTYQADPKAFEKYYTWSKQPYSRGAMTVLGIKRNPADFELSWAAFCASDMYSPKQETTNEDGKGFYV